MTDLLLQRFLSNEFALALSPGFFRFYAHIGFLHALQEAGVLGNDEKRITHVSGSSAGAIVGGFLAAGKPPSDMAEAIFKITRQSIWDIGLGLGLLKGGKLQQLLIQELNVQTFEDCPIELGVTTFDVFKLKTVTHTSGDLPTAIRASCCFPGLFAPVEIDNSWHIDGGIFDPFGLVGMQGVPLSTKLIVNVVFDQASCDMTRPPRPNNPLSAESSPLPLHLRSLSANLLTVVLMGIPEVTPFSMEIAGPAAYNAAKLATLNALQSSCHVQQLTSNHWVFYVDASSLLKSTSTDSKVAATGINANPSTSLAPNYVKSSSGNDNISLCKSPARRGAMTMTAEDHATLLQELSSIAAAASNTELKDLSEIISTGNSGSMSPRRRRGAAPASSTKVASQFSSPSKKRQRTPSEQPSEPSSSTKQASGKTKSAQDVESKHTYMVESILSHSETSVAKKRKFLVKWEGYDESEATWEPLSHVRNCIAFEEYAKKVKLV